MVAQIISCIEFVMASRVVPIGMIDSSAIMIGWAGPSVYSRYTT